MQAVGLRRQANGHRNGCTCHEGIRIQAPQGNVDVDFVCAQVGTKRWWWWEQSGEGNRRNDTSGIRGNNNSPNNRENDNRGDTNSGNWGGRRDSNNGGGRLGGNYTLETD